MATENATDQNFGLTAAYYEGARAEIVARIGLRDQALTLYLTGASLISSLVASLYAFGKTDASSGGPGLLSAASYLLLLVPLLSYAVALVVSQHNTLIGATEAYLGGEFERAVEALGVNIPQWDSSTTMMKTKAGSIKARTLSHRVIILLPALIITGAFVWAQLESRHSLVIDLIGDISQAISAVGALFHTPLAAAPRFDGGDLHFAAWLALAAVFAATGFILRANKAIHESHKKRLEFADLLISRARPAAR